MDPARVTITIQAMQRHLAHGLTKHGDFKSVPHARSTIMTYHTLADGQLNQPTDSFNPSLAATPLLQLAALCIKCAAQYGSPTLPVPETNDSPSSNSENSSPTSSTPAPPTPAQPLQN